MQKHYLIKAIVTFHKDGEGTEIGTEEVCFVVPTRSFRFKNPNDLDEKLRMITFNYIVHRKRYGDEPNNEFADLLVAGAVSVRIREFGHMKIGEYDQYIPLADLTKDDPHRHLKSPHEIRYENKVANISRMFADSPRTHSAAVDTLIAGVEKGPLFDGDVPAKSGRDELMDLGLMTKVVVRGEDGKNAVTHLGRDVYSYHFGKSDSVREAREYRLSRRESQTVSIMQCDVLIIGDRIFPRAVVEKAIADLMGRPVNGVYLSTVEELEAYKATGDFGGTPVAEISHEFTRLHVDEAGVVRGDIKLWSGPRGERLRGDSIHRPEHVKFIPRFLITATDQNGVSVVDSCAFIAIDAVIERRKS